MMSLTTRARSGFPQLARIALVLAVAVSLPALTGCPNSNETFGPTFEPITGPGTVSGSSPVMSDVFLNTAYNYDVTINARTAGQNITLEITRAGGSLSAADAGFTLPGSSSANDTVTINLNGTTGSVEGTLVLAYRATDPDGNVTQILHQINISAEPPTQIFITTQPTASNSTSGEMDVFQSENVGNVVAQLRTAGGVLAPLATNEVTIAIGTNTNSAGSLSGTLTKAAVAGVVTFDDLDFDVTSLETGFTLTLTATGLTSATSTAFNVVSTGPVIFTVAPACIRPGVTVSITGTNFDTTAANNTVHFTGADATPSAATSTTLTVTAPSAITAGTMTVEIPGPSTSPTFTYRLCPDRVNKDSSDTQATGGDSDLPSLSSDGRYIVFQSSATNLVANDTNGVQDIFVKDTSDGSIERVNVDSSENQSSVAASNPHISGDGRYVVFQSLASDLVTGDTNNRIDIFLRDRTNGTTERISVSSSSEESTADCINPRISGDGKFAVFQSTALNLATGKAFSVIDCFVRDLENDTTEVVSLDTSGSPGTQDSFLPTINWDGRYVAFASNANLTASDTNASTDIYRRDRTDSQTVLVSQTNADASLSAGLDLGLGGLVATTAARPAITTDGMHILFLSASPSLTTEFSTPVNVVQVWRRNLNTNATTLESVATGGGSAGNANSRVPSISGDGQYALFHTNATNLDSSDADDIIHRDITNDTTTRVNLNGSGTAANGVCDFPALANDGRVFAFSTDANNLVEDETDDNSLRDIIVSAN